MPSMENRNILDELKATLGTFRRSEEQKNPILDDALEANKSDGMLLAVAARWVALAIIAIMIIFLNPNWNVLYYHAILAGFAITGWLQLQVGEAGRSGREVLLILCDILLMIPVVFLPNPFNDFDWSVPMQLRIGGFSFFYILLAGAVLTYSWRTILSIGTWVALIWTALLVWNSYLGESFPQIAVAVKDALVEHPELFSLLDPNALLLPVRVQEIVGFAIVSAILAVSVWRWNRLVVTMAETQRERTNLARYFSPNVVEELSHNDEPLKQIRTQNVAVLFADIVDFTRSAENDDPTDVIETLRKFCALMEEAVFSHGGTLDKYLGDGLMATFGTPSTGKRDATNAVLCARAMLTAIDNWNGSPERADMPDINIGIGVHYGRVVLGDIGSNRLEFAVIGNTVNIASRLEALTREFDGPLIISDDTMQQMAGEPDFKTDMASQFQRQKPQVVKGIAEPVQLHLYH